MADRAARDAHRSFRLGELAEAVGGEVIGDCELSVSGVRTLEQAGRGELSFVTRGRFSERAAASSASALLVPRALVDAGASPDRPLLVVEDPTWALAQLIALFHPAESPPAGVHPTAVIGEGCEIDPLAHVGPYAVIGAGTRVEDGARIGAHSVVGRDCRIGSGSRLYPHVVLYDRTELGCRVVLHAGVVLGADGFGYATRGGQHHKIPQVGRTVVEDDVEIGALSAVDRALLEETRIGAGTKIDNLVQVGHNVQVGNNCILCGQVGVAGSARLGDDVVLGGQSGVADHVEVSRGVQAAGKSALLQSVTDEGLQVGGIPAVDLKRWRRQVAGVERLGRLGRRVRALEQRLDRLTEGEEDSR